MTRRNSENLGSGMRLQTRNCKKHHRCSHQHDCSAESALRCPDYEPYSIAPIVGLAPRWNIKDMVPNKKLDWKVDAENRLQSLVAGKAVTFFSMKDVFTFLNYLVFVQGEKMITKDSLHGQLKFQFRLYYLLVTEMDDYTPSRFSMVLIPIKICPIEDAPHQRCCTIDDCPYPGSLCEAAHLHPCHGCSQFQTGMESVEQRFEPCYCEKPKLMIFDPQSWAELSSSEQEEVMNNELGCGGFR